MFSVSLSGWRVCNCAVAKMEQFATATTRQMVTGGVSRHRLGFYVGEEHAQKDHSRNRSALAG